MWRFIPILLMLCSGTVAAQFNGWAEAPQWARKPGRQPLQVSMTEVRTAIRGTLAQSSMDFTVSVSGAVTLEAVMEFPLPEGTMITGAALDIKDIMRTASVAVPSVAKQAYESIVNGRMDPCLVQMLPDGRVRVKIYPVIPTVQRRLRLDFVQPLAPVADAMQWKLPLIAGGDVQTTLKVDAPGNPKHGTWVLTDAKMAEEFTAVVAMPAPGEVTAEPDGNGGFVFHGIVPDKSVPAPPPRRVLVVMDASAEMMKRDSASEQKFLEAALAGVESVTLAVFSTALHSTETFPVKDGTCAELHERMRRVRCDGVPLPGLVDLSGTPADAVILCCSLKAPIGGPLVPSLPPGVPVIILNSLSTGFPAARLLAAQMSGAAVDFRTWKVEETAKILTQNLTSSARPGETKEVQVSRLTAPGWLEVSGRLVAESTVLTVGKNAEIRIRRGTDSLRGRMIFTRVNAAAAQALGSSGAPQESVLNLWRKAPVLSETSSFIVMELIEDYLRNRIDLPPDLRTEPQELAPSPPPAIIPVTATGWRDDLMKAVNRVEGYVTGEIPKERIAGLHSDKRMRYWRGRQWYDPRDTGPGWSSPSPPMEPLPAEEVRAALAAGPEQALKIIREAKSREAKRMIEQTRDAAADPFASGPSPPSSQSPSDPFASGPSAEPFSDAGSGPRFSSAGVGVPAPDSLAIPAPEQQPVEKQVSVSSQDADPVLAAWQRKVAVQGYDAAEILSTARALHAAGQTFEACRVLSDLVYVNSMPPPVAVRLILWQLREWQQMKLADTIFAQAVKQWPQDRGLALETNPVPEPQPPNGGADLRVLMECAVDDADMDLEVISPEFEKACWSNPLPRFGGALTKDMRGVIPEEFLLPKGAAGEYNVTVHSQNSLTDLRSAPARVTLITNWGRKDEVRRTFILTACPPGRTVVTQTAIVR